MEALNDKPNSKAFIGTAGVQKIFTIKLSSVETVWLAGSTLTTFSSSDLEVVINRFKNNNEIRRKIKEVFIFL